MMDELRIFSPTPTILFRQIASVPTLRHAWRKVRSNHGAAGVDAVSVTTFAMNLDANLAELSRNLLNRTYTPLPARFVTVPKPGGKERELAILTVRDRIAQRAVLDAVEPLFEAQFMDCSFAFRPGRSVEMAIQQIIAVRAHDFRWTVDTDIQDFFPTISHDLLIREVSRTVDDPDILRLLRQWLNAEVLNHGSPSQSWIARTLDKVAGAKLAVTGMVEEAIDGFLADRLTVLTPLALNDPPPFDEPTLPLPAETAPEPSPIRRVALRRLLGDAALFALAERALLRRALSLKLLGIGGAAAAAAFAVPSLVRTLRERARHTIGTPQGAPVSPLLANIYLHPFDAELTRQGYHLVRYCDDFVILCQSEHQARQALHASEQLLSERRLKLHPEKTRIVSPAEPFDFLGYRFTADGSVVPPPTVPAVIARQIIGLAKRVNRKS